MMLNFLKKSMITTSYKAIKIFYVVNSLIKEAEAMKDFPVFDTK